MSWVDLVFIVMIASAIALGAQRSLAGAVLGFGAALLWVPLVFIAQRSPVAALALALVFAAGLFWLARFITYREQLPVGLTTVLGGFGGAVLGIVLVLALATSLPLQPSLTQPGLYHYPPQNLPAPLASAVQQSAFFELGHAILFSAPEGLRTLFFADRPWTQ
jgi:hypothetical protein